MLGVNGNLVVRKSLCVRQGDVWNVHGRSNMLLQNIGISKEGGELQQSSFSS